MKLCSYRVHLLICFCLCLTGGGPTLASDLQQEYVTTSPVLADGVLYVASSISPGHRGHLRAIDLVDIFPVTLWDAAERMPLAGVGDQPGELASSDPPTIIQRDNRYRSLFTNLAGSWLPLVAGQVGRLQPALGVASASAAAMLLHSVRGRRGGSPEQVAGSADDPQRLWSISRSSPVLVGRSPVNAETGQRDRVLYVGAEDGMLHAFFVDRWDADADSYLIDDPDGGTELWAYLPGSFLAHLKDQPLDDSQGGVDASPGEVAVHLDGSPVVRELFLDLDGDGQRSWHTLLVATGTVAQSHRSCLFVMDITDPYQPELLWEKLLSGEGVGRTRGVTVDLCGIASAAANCIFLTADGTGGNGASAIHALALELQTGQGLWQFTAAYAASGPVTEATPAVPALMDLDGDGRKDTLVFGDLVGQLWALALEDGHAYGDAPIYVVPGGAAEPIGAGVAVHGRLAIFGTGGVEHAADNYQYAVYAVELQSDGSRLRWVYPLAAGEKLWETPTLDASGNLLFATAVDYLSLVRADERPTSGRLVALNHSGEEEVSRTMSAATVGRVVTAPGVVVSVALTGEVTQFGTASRLTGPDGGLGTVKILSWRQR
jgi:outer membrane protein assembly factor BamB